MSRDPLVATRGGPTSSSPSATLHQQQRQRQELQNRRALTTLTLGLAQAFAALSWGNGIGVAIGAATFVSGAALALSSSSASSASSPRIARRAAQALSVYALVLLVVRFASKDPPQVAAFPAACPPGLQGTHGCSRVVADGSSHRPPAPPLDAPFRKRALLSDVERELLRWVGQQSRRVTILKHDKPSSKDGGGFLHVRAVTPLMGFADDFFVRYRCSKKGGEAVVELQGQLRLGVGDAGVNIRRNAAVLAHLRASAEQDGGLPAADACR